MTSQVPEVQFAQVEGARIAYQQWGEGDVDILAIPPMAHNIELAWQWPQVRQMLERFGEFSRYTVFDKRGTGSSGRRSQMPGLDERVEDIRGVMDAAGLDRAHFFVQSDGGPMAVMFAVTYPDRVQSLTFFGSFAHQPTNATPEEFDERVEMNVRIWGTNESRMIDAFAPTEAANQEFRDWHRSYERAAASQESLRELIHLAFEIDVTEVLNQVEVPTLVLHREDDQIISLDLGRELADGIPGARMVVYPGNDHFAYVGGLDPWMTDLEQFVTGQVTDRDGPPKLRPKATIQTLGAFGVTVDDEEITVSDWGSRHARQLLKRLVVARGWPITREVLIDMLWPDETDMRKLGARLSVQLSAIRRVLGGGVIADRESVRLDLDHVDTDLERFYKAVDDTTIVAAYTGELLPDDLYEDWVTAARSEVRHRFATAARRQAEVYRSHGSNDRAAELARRLLEVDEYDDAAWKVLIQSLSESGSARGADEAYKQYVSKRNELGLSVPTMDELLES